MLYWEVRFLRENQLDLIQTQRTLKGEKERRREGGRGELRGPGRIKI